MKKIIEIASAFHVTACGLTAVIGTKESPHDERGSLTMKDIKERESEALVIRFCSLKSLGDFIATFERMREAVKNDASSNPDEANEEANHD